MEAFNPRLDENGFSLNERALKQMIPSTAFAFTGVHGAVVGLGSSCCQNRPYFLQVLLRGTEHEGVNTPAFCHLEFCWPRACLRVRQTVPDTAQALRDTYFQEQGQM